MAKYRLIYSVVKQGSSGAMEEGPNEMEFSGERSGAASTTS
jgi:hypothetical protein